MYKSLTGNPDLLALAAVDADFFPGLLESQSNPSSHLTKQSSAQKATQPRYDILFAHPEKTRVANDHLSLQQLLSEIDCVPKVANDYLPFQWGWLVYLSYEAAAHWLPKIRPLIDEQTLAVAIACSGAVIYDHLTQKTTICGKSQQVIMAIEKRILMSEKWQIQENTFYRHHVESPEAFHKAVEQCRQYIQQGDIYQANLSRKWQYRSSDDISAVSLFGQLKKANPAPFAAFLQTDNFAIISSSPERLFDINNGYVSTRPIAGTHPRGEDLATDKIQIERLTNDVKERAEHIMLVDLERHDIGQVSEIGSVKVNELMVVETYPHVHHIVSNIKGRLLPKVSVVDVIKSLFPGGTITGCPKIRCMQIIQEIEGRPRGVYTGSVGYINHDGRCDFNILIRTLLLRDNQVSFYAGAGIVYDSDADRETAETGHKAEGMIRALQS